MISDKSVLSRIHIQDKETLSVRLAQAMRLLNISQSELARRIGIKPQVIQYLCTSNATRSKFSFDIADALGINVDWLIAGHGKMIEGVVPMEHMLRVPLIEWSQIISWPHQASQNIQPISYINTQIDFGKQCYAVKVNDSSMSPRFEIGTILIVEPEVPWQEKDFVIAITEFSETPIIRQLIGKNEKLFLMPTNTILYKEVILNEDTRIVGVLRQIFYEFVRR